MRILVIGLALAPVLAHAQYKCVDPQGRTTFQQTACVGLQKQQLLNVHAAPPDAAQPQPASMVGKSADERILATLVRDRRIREIEQVIADTDFVINNRNAAMTGEMDALRNRKVYAKNNLAGATWEQSVSMEMQAVASKYKTMNDADFERLKMLRTELESTRRPASR